MKATIVSNEVQDFEPIKIELVLESKSDLFNLLIRLNEPPPSLNNREIDSRCDYPEDVLADDSLNSLWNQLDDIAADRGLIPSNLD